MYSLALFPQLDPHRDGAQRSIHLYLNSQDPALLIQLSSVPHYLGLGRVFLILSCPPFPTGGSRGRLHTSGAFPHPQDPGVGSGLSVTSPACRSLHGPWQWSSQPPVVTHTKLDFGTPSLGLSGGTFILLPPQRGTVLWRVRNAQLGLGVWLSGTAPV